MTFRGRIKYVASRTMLVLFGLALALAVSEGVLRIVPLPNRFTLAAQMQDLWQSDPQFLLRLKPDLDVRVRGHPEFSFTVRTNGDGLRDERFVGDCYVSAIGDSFTFGFGVEEQDSWPARLEAISGVCVANLGWVGWNSHVYPAAITRYAIPLETRVWLWAFFGNDLPESASAEEFLIHGQAEYKEWVLEGGIPMGDPPFPLSLRTVQLLAALADPDLLLLPGSGDRVFDDGILRMRCGTYAWDVTDPDKPEVQRGWELTEAALLEARGLAQAHDAALVVLFLPNREHVYWERVQGLMTDVDIQQLDDVEARLASFCETQGIEYLSLLSGFQSRAGQGEMLYFPQDGHWNEQGHDLAARLVHDFLQERGLLPE